jgi:hypothetical protein
VSCLSEADQTCPAGTLLEPYSGICASINDKTHLFIRGRGSLSIQSIPSLTELRKKKALMHGLKSDDAPVPGGNGGGITYKSGNLQALEQAELHTKMFVYPSGWNPSLDRLAYLADPVAKIIHVQTERPQAVGSGLKISQIFPVI